MSLAFTTPAEFQFTAPDFTLPDTVTGDMLGPEDVKGTHGTVIIFICNHCPYVIHIRHALVQVANTYIPLGIGFAAISVNDPVNYPQDAPDMMKKKAFEWGMPFPYLFDESQQVARDYMASCTPDLNLFDRDLKLYYRGRFDGATPDNGLTSTGKDLVDAMDRLLANAPAPEVQHPGCGCSIKWKSA